MRPHLFPFRTQKLSSLVPKIVGWKRPVKIGRCRLLKTQPPGRANGPARGCLYAPLAQLVEQLTLNQWVLGSSPRWCTKISPTEAWGLFFASRPGKAGVRAPSGTRTARAGRPTSRPAKTPLRGGFRARESPRCCTKKVLSRMAGDFLLHHPLRGGFSVRAGAPLQLAGKGREESEKEAG